MTARPEVKDGTHHTAFCLVVAEVAVPVRDGNYPIAVLHHFGGDVVVVHARRFWIDAGKPTPLAANVVIVLPI